MDAIGKTVKRIEEGPTGEYGHVDHDTVLIHFTDGTALKIVGSSYEEVSQHVDLIDRAAVNALARAAAGRRESERLSRLQREEWLSISCEERGERKRAEQAKMGPFALMMRQEFEDALVDQMHEARRLAFGDQPERRIRQPCKNCGERLCLNAPVKIIPAQKGIGLSGGYRVQVATGTIRPA